MTILLENRLSIKKQGDFFEKGDRETASKTGSLPSKKRGSTALLVVKHFLTSILGLTP